MPLTKTQPAIPAPVTEAIILAGGLGTRLRDAVPELPKCMAPVAGHPFLYYVINALRFQGVQKIIFSLGYKHELIEQWLHDHCPTLEFETVIEETPLGTGGAIRFALQKAQTEVVAIANGDTLYKVSVQDMFDLHQQTNAECTLALKPMQNFDRFGVVEINDQHVITQFREKQHYASGLINGGVYLISREKFLAHAFPEKFSFEQAYLEKKTSVLAGSVQDAYFIDMGIPEDYNRAQTEFQLPPLDLSKIDKSWTLFLDRDGVLNEDKEGSYIFHPDEFKFLEGVPECLKTFADRFGRILLATNQRGVGKGLMEFSMLETIHGEMLQKIEAAGGRIDSFYAGISTDYKHLFRKPNAGIARAAKQDYPEIDFSKSIMVGNNLSDMRFGRNTGMHTVFIKSTRPQQEYPHPDIDAIYTLLADFAKAL